MSTGAVPLDDNGKPVLGLYNDATGKVIPVHVGATVTGSDGNTYGKMDISGTVTAANPSVGTDGSAIPASSTLLGASDGTNLQQLLVESATQRNLRVALFNAGNELAVDASGRLTLIPNSSVNVAQLNGSATSTNAGTSDAGTQRVVSAGAATGTKSNVASSVTSVTILASNTSRKGAIIYNDSTQILYLDLSGGTASSSSYSVQVPSNGYFEVPGPVIYNGAITGIWAAANGNARVTEWT